MEGSSEAGRDSSSALTLAKPTSIDASRRAMRAVARATSLYAACALEFTEEVPEMRFTRQLLRIRARDAVRARARVRARAVHARALRMPLVRSAQKQSR